jgi:hypothetical protein
VDGFGREHQVRVLLEESIDIAATSVRMRFDILSKLTDSLFRFPGMIPVMTVCSRPIACHEADPPFECPSKLFCAMTGQAFPGVLEMDVKMSFQIFVSFFSCRIISYKFRNCGVVLAFAPVLVP